MNSALHGFTNAQTICKEIIHSRYNEKLVAPESYSRIWLSSRDTAHTVLFFVSTSSEETIIADCFHQAIRAKMIYVKHIADQMKQLKYVLRNMLFEK